MAISRKRKIIIAVAAVAVLGLIVVISIFARGKDEPEVTVVKVEVRPELKSTVTASGEVRPVKFINLTSEVAGKIEEIAVNPGDHVTTGQALVRVDPTQLASSAEAQAAGVQVAISDVQNARGAVTAAENNVSQAQQGLNAAEVGLAQARQTVVTAQTNVDQAQTGVERAQVDLATARRELKRVTELVESGVSSRSEYDAAKDREALALKSVQSAQSNLRTAQAQLKAQQIAIEEAKARVNQQRVSVREAQIGVQRARSSVSSSEARANQQQALLRGQSSQRYKATTYAPLTGVVADIPARVGQYALAGFSTTSLMTIADMTTINIEVNVDETEISKVKVGQKAKIKVDALGERELEGEVKLTNPLAISKTQAAANSGLGNNINVQEAKELKVVLQLVNLPDDVREALRPGMTATANITTDTKQNVIAVPLQAIVEKQPSPTPTPAAGSAPPAPTEKPKDIKGVYVMENGKVKFITVQTGITGESDIEITGGLNAGVEVITGPSRVLRTLKEGASVKKQVKKPGDTDAKSEEKK
ncbi:MAG: efflux RND transporter periplasmic adaptor subunit [Acidobacteria bacterium]|nr:efflux RND transporter periplasmic adaptor subunit [Acidobacteriota bacterium]